MRKTSPLLAAMLAAFAGSVLPSVRRGRRLPGTGLVCETQCPTPPETHVLGCQLETGWTPAMAARHEADRARAAQAAQDRAAAKRARKAAARNR